MRHESRYRKYWRKKLQYLAGLLLVICTAIAHNL